MFYAFSPSGTSYALARSRTAALCPSTGVRHLCQRVALPPRRLPPTVLLFNALNTLLAMVLVPGISADLDRGLLSPAVGGPTSDSRRRLAVGNPGGARLLGLESSAPLGATRSHTAERGGVWALCARTDSLGGLGEGGRGRSLVDVSPLDPYVVSFGLKTCASIFCFSLRTTCFARPFSSFL